MYAHINIFVLSLSPLPVFGHHWFALLQRIGIWLMAYLDLSYWFRFRVNWRVLTVLIENERKKWWKRRKKRQVADEYMSEVLSLDQFSFWRCFFPKLSPIKVYWWRNQRKNVDSFSSSLSAAAWYLFFQTSINERRDKRVCDWSQHSSSFTFAKRQRTG